MSDDLKKSQTVCSLSGIGCFISTQIPCVTWIRASGSTQKWVTRYKPLQSSPNSFWAQGLQNELCYIIVALLSYCLSTQTKALLKPLPWDRCIVFPITWLIKLHSLQSLSPKPCSRTLIKELEAEVGQCYKTKTHTTSQVSLIYFYHLLQISILCWTQFTRNTVGFCTTQESPKYRGIHSSHYRHKKMMPFLTWNNPKLQVMKALQHKSLSM